MNLTTICCVIAVLLIYTSGCNSANETTSNSGPDKTSLPNTPVPARSPDSNSNSAGANTSAAGTGFWISAASGGMAEVELGRLASTKAQNPEVKRFAEMMITDHTKSNEELKGLATKKNISLPAAPDPKHQATMERLRPMSGSEFDRAYVEAMVVDHEATVQLFESQTQGNNDPDARSFAEKTLPTLRRHLEMIKGIQARLK